MRASVLSQPIATVEAGMGRKPNQIVALRDHDQNRGRSPNGDEHLLLPVDGGELRPVGAQLQQLLGARRPIFNR